MPHTRRCLTGDDTLYMGTYWIIALHYTRRCLSTDDTLYMGTYSNVALDYTRLQELEDSHGGTVWYRGQLRRTECLIATSFVELSLAGGLRV